MRTLLCAFCIAILFGAGRVFADQSTQLVPGTTITLSVSANGSPPFTYQWRKNGVNVGGATQASLVLPAVTNADAGEYSVVVSNSAGSTISDLAVITPAATPATPPAIVSQPSSQTVLLDEEAVLNVVASGSVPFTYQWKKNGTDIPGATESTFSIDPVTAGDFGLYTVLVSNSAGSALSEPAQLTDATVPPAFGSQLASHTINTGSNIVFSLGASGTPPLSYQWRKDGISLVNGPGVSGVNTATLSLTGVTPASSGTYTLIASNSAGSATSNNATLSVVDPPPADVAPSFILQPTSQLAVLGQTVTFATEVSARPNATFRWQRNGSNLFDLGKYSGTSTPILTITSVDGANSGSYRLIATNSVGTATSIDANLNVNTSNVPPIFTTQPVSQLAQLGQPIYVSFQAIGVPKPAFQWQKNGQNLANGANVLGANTNTLFISVFSQADVGTYSVVASNSAGSTTSDSITIGVSGTPVIQAQPPALTVVNSGANVTLALTVAADPAPTYQWRRNGANLANGGGVSGVTGPTLTLANITTAETGRYSVVITNSKGTITGGDYEVSIVASNVAIQPATTGKDVVLASPGATGSLQWQLGTTSGGGEVTWTNLANSGGYSGVTTNTLQISNVSPDLNNALFRLVDNATGTPVLVHSARLTVAAAFLPFPTALSSDASGNLYVADTSTDTIGRINAANQFSVHAGTSGQTGTTDGSGAAARFNDPAGVAAAPDGSFAVADTANATIRIVTSAGSVTTLAGSTTNRGNTDGTGSAATFSSPIGVARDASGNYFVADAQNHTIRRVTSAGVVTTFAGGAGQAGTANGTGAAARFNNPVGIDIDATGNLFVSDSTNNTIRRITPAAEVTTLAGLEGIVGSSDGTGANALFNRPTGLAVDRNTGIIYVADTGNSTIRRITAAGEVSTLAGLPGVAGLKDGNGGEAWFNQPLDVSVDASGLIFVADTGNAIIRRITAQGTVSTLALSSQSSPNAPDAPTPPPPPSTPNPLPTPQLPSGPTPPATGGGGGGGGAPSAWFFGTLALLWGLRSLRAPRR